MKDLVITDVSQFVLLFPSLLDETLRLYEDDKLFLAHKAVQKMRNSLAHHQAAVDAYTAEVQVGLKGIEMEMEKHSKRMQTIMKEANEVLQLIEELEDDQGWSLVSQHEDGNVQVFYRNENSTPVHSIKMQGIIDSPALNLMAVMNEHTLYDTWIPLLREVQLVKHISRYRKVIYLSAYLPWPISSRDALLYGYGVDNLEEDRAVIMIRSVGEGDLEPALVPPVKSHVRVDIHSTGVLIQPISQARTRVVMMTNVDPKLAYLPYTLLNWATKVLAYQMWSTMARHSHQIEGSEYERLIAQDAAFYADIKTKLHSYHNSEEDTTLLQGGSPTMQPRPTRTRAT